MIVGIDQPSTVVHLFGVKEGVDCGSRSTASERLMGDESERSHKIYQLGDSTHDAVSCQSRIVETGRMSTSQSGVRALVGSTNTGGSLLY